MFKYSKRSLDNLQECHQDIQRVMHRAIEISPVDFVVTCGERSVKEQRALYHSGASKTMNSRHIPKTPTDGHVNFPVSHAIDVAAWMNGGIRWDWPLYDSIAVAIKRAAQELNIPIEWGGDWQSFRDGPHFQLPWRDYP